MSAPLEQRPSELQPEVLSAVRRAVRRLLEDNPEYQRAPPALRKALAANMVKVSKHAAELLAEEKRLTEQVARRAPVARAQSAGDQLGLQAARNAGATVQALKDAIDFPTFVTSLISGVFQAITRSSVSQLEALGDLLDNVGKSTEEFTDANVDDGSAIAWALQKFPFLTTDQGGLTLREGADLEAQAGPLRSALGADESEVSGIDPSDLAGTLLPLVKRKMGRSRQANLATMVQLGLQRIVVDEGRLHASMELRVDTSSVSEEMKAQRDDWRVNAGASGSFGAGAWGAAASVSTSVGKVASDAQYTKEQLESRAALRSSVDLAFRTEQIPLDRMADQNARVKLNLAARVPADITTGSGAITSTSPQMAVPDFGAVPDVPAAPTAPSPQLPGSTGGSGARRPPTGGGTTTRRPTGESGAARRPTGESGAARRPTGGSTTTRRPAGESGTTRRPAGESGATRTPAGESGATPTPPNPPAPR